MEWNLNASPRSPHDRLSPTFASMAIKDINRASRSMLEDRSVDDVKKDALFGTDGPLFYDYFSNPDVPDEVVCRQLQLILDRYQVA